MNTKQKAYERHVKIHGRNSVGYKCFKNRMVDGRTIEEAIFTPKGGKKRNTLLINKISGVEMNKVIIDEFADDKDTLINELKVDIKKLKQSEDALLKEIENLHDIMNDHLGQIKNFEEVNAKLKDENQKIKDEEKKDQITTKTIEGIVLQKQEVVTFFAGGEHVTYFIKSVVEKLEKEKSKLIIEAGHRLIGATAIIVFLVLTIIYLIMF